MVVRVKAWLVDHPAPLASHGAAPLALVDRDDPEPGPGEVRVRIAASGLCHTDWETMHGLQPGTLPAVLGHEGAGVVESFGLHAAGSPCGQPAQRGEREA